MIVRTGAVVRIAIVMALAAAAIPAAAQAPGVSESGHGLRGLVPRVRLFCGPCFDEYAQEVWVRSLRWERTAIEDGWTRPQGAMFVPPLQPEPAVQLERRIAPERTPMIVINDAVFDPATVYVRHRDEWVNVAIALGLAGRRALPTLPPYIPVQQAPIPEEPRGEWGR